MDRKFSDVLLWKAREMTTKTSPLREKLDVKAPSDVMDYLNILIYGPPGVGKTVLAGTAQDSLNTAPALFLDFEGGTTSLRKQKNLDVKRIKSVDELTQTHKLLTEENDGYYKTVIIDSLTELQKLDMQWIMRELIQRRPDLDPDVPSQREWGKSIEHMRRIVRGFRDLPMNTIFTALVNIDKDENGVTSYTPSLPGKLRMEISGFMDVVAYYSATIDNEETTRRLQLAGTRKVIAKDRTDSLGTLVENPTIPMLWELMHNSST